MAYDRLLRSGALTENRRRSRPGGTSDFSWRQLDAEVRIDYFAMSLPNSLLFGDDLQRNRTECLFLSGLAKLGLRRIEESAADFREALTLDVNHMWARAELERMEPAQAARLKP